MGRERRPGTHRHPQPVDWGSKGRWFKSSRPDIAGLLRAIDESTEADAVAAEQGPTNAQGRGDSGPMASADYPE